MMIAIPAKHWQVFQKMSVAELASTLKSLARPAVRITTEYPLVIEFQANETGSNSRITAYSFRRSTITSAISLLDKPDSGTRFDGNESQSPNLANSEPNRRKVG